jgi:superoxide dismutase, Fe-Mn family
MVSQHVAPIPCKPWTLDGLPDDLIVSHYENNYGSAVRALNAVRDRLADLDMETTPDYELRSLKREELAAMGSVALHEIYFESLGGDGAVLFTGVGSGTKMPQPIAGAVEQQFGSLANWKREFVGLARALAGGSGWLVLSYSRHDGGLHNQLALDDSQALTDGVPLLALDMYEHAYQRTFGANAQAYVDAFMRNVDWAAVNRRLTQAGAARSPSTTTGDQAVPSMTAEELMAARARGEPLQVIDARPRFHVTRATDMMADAVYRDPYLVEDWMSELAPDKPVVVYCAYGFNVGCAVVATLRDRGFLNARYLSGGLSAWYAAGGARALRPPI